MKIPVSSQTRKTEKLLEAVPRQVFERCVVYCAAMYLEPFHIQQLNGSAPQQAQLPLMIAMAEG